MGNLMLTCLLPQIYDCQLACLACLSHPGQLHTSVFNHLACLVMCVTLQAAAAAEVQTELAARVSTWRHKIQPLLDEQDARPAFDIHSYGDQILDRLASLSCKDCGNAVDQNASMVGDTILSRF